MNTSLLKQKDITIRERELVRDCQGMNKALETFSSLFEDVSRIDRDSLHELDKDLREAGRADLADRVTGWLK